MARKQKGNLFICSTMKLKKHKKRDAVGWFFKSVNRQVALSSPPLYLLFRRLCQMTLSVAVDHYHIINQTFSTTQRKIESTLHLYDIERSREILITFNSL